MFRNFTIKIFILIIFVCFFIVGNEYLIGKSHNLSKNELHQMSNTLISQKDIPETRKPHYNFKSKQKRIYISSFKQILSYLDAHQWPLIITMSTGRLGNSIHNYALNLVIQQKFPNASYFVSEKIYNAVRTVFAEDSLSLPVINDDTIFTIPPSISYAFQPRENYVDVFSYVFSSIKLVLGKKKILLLEAYPIEFFEGYEEFLFNSFKLRDDIKYEATVFLNKAILEITQKRNAADVTFIGVHIRRQDYLSFVRTRLRIPSLPGKSYFGKTFRYYKNRFQHPVFVVCSDDTNYVKKLFKGRKDVVISVNRTAAEDFALLASCSHSIMTVGSFGFWASFFAGGRVLYAWLKNARVLPIVDPIVMGNAFDQFLEINPFH